MHHLRLLAVVAVCLLLARIVAAGDAPLVPATAHGTVETADKDTLKIRPRDAGGKFGKTLVLKVTGTSKITTVSLQKRAGKAVVVQRDTDAKDLQPNQPITVIYVAAPAGQVLLAAVVLPPTPK